MWIQGLRVAAARFEQQHAIAAGLRQPMRQHAARAARPDDDVIEMIPGHAVVYSRPADERNASSPSLSVFFCLLQRVELCLHLAERVFQRRKLLVRGRGLPWAAAISFSAAASFWRDSSAALRIS